MEVWTVTVQLVTRERAFTVQFEVHAEEEQQAIVVGRNSIRKLVPNCLYGCGICEGGGADFGEVHTHLTD